MPCPLELGRQALGRRGQAEVGEVLAGAGVGGRDPRLRCRCSSDELGIHREGPDLDGLAGPRGAAGSLAGSGQRDERVRALDRATGRAG